MEAVRYGAEGMEAREEREGRKRGCGGGVGGARGRTRAARARGEVEVRADGPGWCRMTHTIGGVGVGSLWGTLAHLS